MSGFPGYRRLLGPELLSLAGRPVLTERAYKAWHEIHVRAMGGEPWNTPEIAWVRVNHGRWVADCAHCGGGMLVRPGWGLALCGECGARHGEVAFPREAERIERILTRRIRRDTQNWAPPQGIDDLERENAGLGVRTK